MRFSIQDHPILRHWQLIISLLRTTKFHVAGRGLYTPTLNSKPTFGFDSEEHIRFLIIVLNSKLYQTIFSKATATENFSNIKNSVYKTLKKESVGDVVEWSSALSWRQIVIGLNLTTALLSPWF